MQTLTIETTFSTKTITTECGATIYLRKQGRLISLNVSGDLNTDVGNAEDIYTLPVEARPIGNFFFAAFNQSETNLSPHHATVRTGYLSTSGDLRIGAFSTGAKVRMFITTYISANATPLT